MHRSIHIGEVAIRQHHMSEFTLVQFRYGTTLPLSVPYLAYGLTNSNIKFNLRIFGVQDLYRPGQHRLDSLYSFLTDSEEVIALGCFSDVLPYAIITIKRIKEQFPNKIIILGGVGPSTVAKEILETFDFVDFVLTGCGISTLPLLIERIKDGGQALPDVPNLVFRNNGLVVTNRSTSLTPPIPSLPRYDIMGDLESYNRFLLQTSVGCPYKCTFCYALPATGKKLVYRDMEEVIEEILLIKKMNNGREFLLRIIDESFVVDENRVKLFCEMLQRKNLKIDWVCYGRIDRMNAEMIQDMVSAGCKEIFYGVESGSNRILRKIKKGFTIEEGIETLIMTKQYLPGVTASFIYRYPFETIDDFKGTIAALRYLQYKNITTQLHPLVPVRNSELHRQYKDMLTFSEKEPINYVMKNTLGFFPRECVDLILKHPDVFYDYGYYRSDDLEKINNILKQNRNTIFTNVHRYWRF